MMNPLTALGSLSPSLVGQQGGRGPAYELKFLLDEAQARQVEVWALRSLVLDPHGEPALGGAYQTTSLYCDTPQLDVYHRSPSYRRRKFRVRRYGSSSWAFLERKAKAGDRVAKRRVMVPDEELPRLAQPLTHGGWPGHWFHRSLLLRRLQPACLISYSRNAYVCYTTETPMRLTLDRQVRGILSGDWRSLPFEGGVPILTGQVILELKFRLALPALFKELVQEMKLAPSAVSKYRLCRQAWDTAAPQGAAHA